MKHRFIPLFVATLLAIIPFFWLKPGWVDLGGDSSRLYFYDPWNYLQSFALWGIAPDGFGGQNVGYYLIPFVSLLYVVKLIVQSPSLLITLFNSLQLVVAFLSIYWIIREFLHNVGSEQEKWKILAAVSAALFYTLSPFLINNGWDRAKFDHNQFFLYPFIFFLVLKYIHTKKMIFLFFSLLLTFIFAPNFTPQPGLFAFFPIAFTYLFLYARMVKKIPLGMGKLLVAAFLFVIVHLFHLLPQVMAIFGDQSSAFYQAAFSEEGKLSRGLGYFISQVGVTKFVNNLTILPQLPPHQSLTPKFTEPFWFIIPAVLILGLIAMGKTNVANRSQKNNFLLLVLFFLLSLFLITAKVTDTGLFLYKSLFNIPGFSMFRNYVGQFAYVFVFFYALTFAYALFFLLEKLRKPYRLLFTLLLAGLIIGTASQFIRGDMTNLIINPGGKKEVNIPIKMDPEYEKVLQYIREDPIDGKYLTLPFTEAGLQMLAGTENGAYMGPSTIAYLAGKKDFSGYQVLTPFSELFLRLVRDRNYASLNQLLGLLNIRYIFYNSDPYIYGENFPGLPYQHVNMFMPSDQKSYRTLIEQLPIEDKKDFGSKYHLYRLKQDTYLPHIFVTPYILTASIDEIENILSLYPITQKRIAIDTSQNGISKERLFLQSKKIDVYTRINKNFPIPVQYPFAKWKPDSLVYPLIIFKENYRLKKFLASEDSHIDANLLFSAKRISELAKWEGGFHIAGTARNREELLSYFQEPVLWNINTWKRNYATWEIALSRYIQNLDEVLAVIEKSKNNIGWKIEKKSKVYEALVSHYGLFNNIIYSSDRSKKEKNYLFGLVDAIFSYYSQKLDYNPLSPSAFEYTVHNPSEQASYQVYMNRETVGDIDIANAKLTFDDVVLRPQGEPTSSSLIDFGKIQLPKQEKVFYLSFPRRSIVSDQLWDTTDSIKAATESSGFTLQSFSSKENKGLDLKSGFIKVIQDWEQKSHYLLSFDYNTHGDNFEMSLWLKQKQNNESPRPKEYAAVFFETNNTREWRTFNAVIESQNIETGIFHIKAKSKKVALSQIDVKNFQTVKLAAHPEIIFKRADDILSTQNDKDSNNLLEKETPKIIFRKINPTRYEVQVTRAKHPYTLVFLDGLSKNWKLFLRENAKNMANTFSVERFVGRIGALITETFVKEKTSQEKIVAVYSNGDIQEREHRNVFLDTATFEMWGAKPIADDRHFQANGYANAWHIKPEDVDGQEDYIFILEMTSQRIFYITFAISLLGVFSVITLLVFSFIKHEKNTK